MIYLSDSEADQGHHHSQQENDDACYPLANDHGEINLLSHEEIYSRINLEGIVLNIKKKHLGSKK